MPLPDILKRRISRKDEENKTRPKLKLPLEGFEVDQTDHKDNNNAGIELVTCIQDILERNVALGYFIQYLNASKNTSLIKFWLDITSFKAASSSSNSQESDKVLSPGTDSLDSGIHSQYSEKSTSPLTEDAVQIYQRYVAPDCPYPINLTIDLKQDIVHGICAEDGQVDFSCFDPAKNHVFQTFERIHYPDFMRSAFYAKHQLEVFAEGSGVTIQGLLHNDLLLFYFMEFMETEGKSERSLLEFWMTANNYQKNQDIQQSDAMLIYEKFISLQASNPLGFSNALRSTVEESICSPNGATNQCFDQALFAVEKVLEKNFMSKFLNSSLFSKYLNELSSTIETSGIRQRSVSGSSLNTTCSSETISSSTTATPQGISSRNTLLASTSSSNRTPGRRNRSPDFLDKTTESDFLWRRKQTLLTNIGQVDHFGRYTSCLDLPPDVQQKKEVISGMEPNMKAKITKAVRKIMTNDDMEKLKEEMAWQMAELIVTDVINRPKYPPNDEEILSSLGAPSTPSKSQAYRKISS